MTSFLIRYALQPGPGEKLPAAAGLLDAAEECGLSWVMRTGGESLRLPEGMLWGEFDTPIDALGAFDQAMEIASDLLGFEVTASRRLALRLDDLPGRVDLPPDASAAA